MGRWIAPHNQSSAMLTVVLRSRCAAFMDRNGFTKPERCNLQLLTLALADTGKLTRPGNDGRARSASCAHERGRRIRIATPRKK